MSLVHFYLDEQVLASETEETFPLRLSTDDARHARALRLAPGEHVAVIDADQDYFECEVVSFSGDLPTVRISRRLDRRERGPEVVLLQGLAKGDKVDAVIRQATELGVSHFVPLVCERSVVRLDGKKGAARTARWRSVARSAAMQSGQPTIPDVSEPRGIGDMTDPLSRMVAVLVCWEEAPTTARLADALERGFRDGADASGNGRVAIVVGPEGGLTGSEVEALLASNPRASLVSLGTSILRTETAGVTASALTLYELGELGNEGREELRRDGGGHGRGQEAGPR